MTPDERNDLLTKIATQVNDLHKCVFGNGRAGLQDRVTIIETNQINCPARRRNWLGIVSVVCAAVSSLVAVVMCLLLVLDKF